MESFLCHIRIREKKFTLFVAFPQSIYNNSKNFRINSRRGKVNAEYQQFLFFSSMNCLQSNELKIDCH